MEPGMPDQRSCAGPVSENLTPVGHQITAADRRRRLGHHGAVVWLTGLSGAGKSTLAMELEKQLFDARVTAYVLDGNDLRRGLSSDLGFSPEDRRENIRREGEACGALRRRGPGLHHGLHLALS